MLFRSAVRAAEEIDQEVHPAATRAEMQVGEEDGAEAVRPSRGERVHDARLEAAVVPPK